MIHANTYPLSISNTFHNKEPRNGSANWQDFQKVEWTPEDLQTHVAAGNAFSPYTFRENHRKTENFIAAQVIGLDFDDKGDIDNLLQDTLIGTYAGYLYATPTSSPDTPKCRVVFFLDRAICDPDELRRTLMALHDRYPGTDGKVNDPARLFFGSTQPDHRLYPDKVLPLSVLRELTPDDVPATPSRPSRSSRQHVSQLPPEAHGLSTVEADKLECRIRSALNHVPAWGDYDDWLHMLMAVHTVFPDQRGVKIIEDWSPGTPGEVANKFRSFDTQGAIGLGTLFRRSQDHGWTDNVPFETQADRYVHAKYVSELRLPQQSLAIRSDLGTGKTTWVNHAIRDLHQSLGREPRVLVLTHRSALATNLAERLGATDYQQLVGDTERLRQAQRLVCCVNSIYKLMGSSMTLPAYDLVVIDEVEQVADHFFGKTFDGNKGNRAFQITSQLIRMAGRIISLDAYMGTLTRQWLDPLRTDLLYIENTYRRHQGTMQVYTHWSQAAQILRHRLEAYDPIIDEVAHPIIVLCEQKARAKALHAWLIGLPYLDGEDVQLVHGDNSSYTDVAQFIANINTELPKRRVLVTSPTLSTGVDIQVEVDCVIGIFGGNVLTAPNLHQFLGRYRKAKEFHVYLPAVINGGRSENPDGIRQLVLREAINNGRVLPNFDQHVVTASPHDKTFLDLYAQAEAEQNSGLNHLMPHFAAIAEHRYTLKWCDSHRSEADYELERSIKTVQRTLKKDEQDKILNTEPVDTQQYQQARSEGQLTPEIDLGHLRFQIEEGYGQPLTLSLLSHWDNGNGLDKLKRFINLHRSASDTQMSDLWQIWEDVPPQKLTNAMLHRQALLAILRTVYPNGFHSDPIRDSDLQPILEGVFIGEVEAYQPTLKSLFRRKSYSADYKTLRYLLRQLGLNLTQKRHGYNGSGGCSFTIPESDLDAMRALARTAAAHHRITIDLETLGYEIKTP